MVELDVVDFICCLCLEPLVDQVVFPVCDPQLLIIKNGSETGVANKSAITLILILEEWFDQKSSMSHVGSNSLHTCV